MSMPIVWNGGVREARKSRSSEDTPDLCMKTCHFSFISLGAENLHSKIH